MSDTTETFMEMKGWSEDLREKIRKIASKVATSDLQTLLVAVNAAWAEGCGVGFEQGYESAKTKPKGKTVK